MEKIFSAAFLILSIISSAQSASISAKANLLYLTQSGSWNNISTSTFYSGKSSAGYNIGLSAKVDLAGFFVMPELYYTTFKNEFTEGTTNTTLEARSNRIDLPVLFGKNILLKKVGIYIGPVASYNLAKQDTWNNFSSNAPKNFTIGFQYGAMVTLGKLVINGRYESAFTKDQRTFINTVASQTISYDSRPNLVHIGLGYTF